MTDYFTDYAPYTASKGLPSPADTPYETPGFIRSKRISRGTASTSREGSPSPPPLPPDMLAPSDISRGHGAVDPRRFTPTLHASLVSEILTLRRELESKNNLVDNLETNLAASKQESETLGQKLSSSAKEMRNAKRQVQQLEKGTLDIVEELAKERDAARASVEELKGKLETAHKTTRNQDDDALRTQRIWESEKENWESERRQLERRIHVTESRLRAFVEEMTARQAADDSTHKVLVADVSGGDESVFKDSGFGNESDSASVPSAASSPIRHRRNISSLSRRSPSKLMRHSLSDRSNTDTPEPQVKGGFSLADELGIDEEDEYDGEEFEQVEAELLEYPERAEHLRRTLESRQSNIPGLDADSKAKRVLGLAPEITERPVSGRWSKSSADLQHVLDAGKPPAEPSPVRGSFLAEQPKVQYVDTGYQPSPPPSPPLKAAKAERAIDGTADVLGLSLGPTIIEPPATPLSEMATIKPAKPASPPETPVVDQEPWIDSTPTKTAKQTYVTACTQTDIPETVRPKTPEMSRTQRDRLSSPSLVPSIAIHPPTSRPSTPLNYVLPPRTKNASTQANLSRPWSSRDASMQTEEIRVDKRPVKLPPHLLPSFLLPSPTLPEREEAKRTYVSRKSDLSIQPPPPGPLSTNAGTSTQSPLESPVLLRDDSHKDLRSMPLRILPLPRPVLSPPQSANEDSSNEGTMSRAAGHGDSKNRLADVEKDFDLSDYEEPIGDFNVKGFAGILPGISKALVRMGQFDPPQAVPEDKAMSPVRRPGTSGSIGAAPAPSVASSRTTSRNAKGKQVVKPGHHKNLRSRSPSLGSMASSSYSAGSALLPFHSGLPPYPIPTRSSSRVISNSYSEGSQSPTPYPSGQHRSERSQHSRQASLRKVQSAAAIRHGTRRSSPPKSRRRRRSPELTPVQSMAFDSPTPTSFPLPEIPAQLVDNLHYDQFKASGDTTAPPTTADSTAPPPHSTAPETNLVDAIAATMVGEWMWKYIRKRKSFGVGEDFPLTAEDGGVNPAAHGSRHKRWVWLSPYERCIMWDSKQPANNSALLGKKGRKLAIQSVMDVQDDYPLPRNAELASAFNRSILILTPQRALKFTTVTHERHRYWMTALSFLAESSRPLSQMPSGPSAPPPPSVDSVPIKRYRETSFGRSNVRDSIRLAKGKRPSVIPPLPTAAPPPIPSTAAKTHRKSALPAPHTSDPVEDQGADFPAIPRVPGKHQRKRSNTSPRPSGVGSRASISANGGPSNQRSASSGNAAGFEPGHASSTSSVLIPPISSGGGSGTGAGGGGFSSLASSSLFRGSSSKGTATTSAHSNQRLDERPNFFEAVGTVRMEAFVDPNVRDGVLYLPGPPGRSQGRKRGDSTFSQATVEKRRAGYVFDEFDMDPFRHF